MNIYNEEPTKEKSSKEGPSVQAVERALFLLRVIGEASTPISISTIAKQTELNRTTVWRLVSSLENEGFVEKDPASKGYQLGFTMYQLVFQNNPDVPLIRRARQMLEELRDESGETVLLSVPRNNGILTIDQINTEHAIRLIDYSNTFSPLHCTSNGKVYLSLLPEQELDILLSHPLKAYTKNTITNVGELRKELAKIREQKVGLCVGELDDNENAISAPIFYKENLVAFITIGGPSFRLQKDSLPLWRSRLLETAHKIEESLL